MTEDFFDRLAKGTPPAAKGGGDFFDRLSKAPPSKASVPLATMDTRKGLPAMRDNAPAPRKVGFEALPSLEQVDKFMGVAPGQSLLDGRQIISRTLHAAKDGLGLVDRGARAVVGDNAVDALSDPANMMIPGIGQLGAALKMGSSATKARVAPTVSRIAEQAPLTAATGAAIAAKKLSPVVQRVQNAAKSVARGPEERWLNKQVKNNPYAAYDAEVVADFKGLTTKRATIGADGKLVSPVGRAPLDALQINNLEATYQGRYKEMIDGFDIPPSEKLRYKLALDADHSGKLDDVNGMRGTPQGDAVADAIIKTQRLRDLSKETPAGGWKAMASNAAGVVGAVAPYAIGGAIASPIGALTAGLARSGVRRLVKGEASRVNMATKFIDQSNRYAKLGERVGPSGAVESRAALTDAYNTAADGAYVGAKTDASTKAAFGDAFPNAGTKDPKVRVDPATGASSAVVAKLKALEPKSSALDAFDKKMAAADKVVTDARTTAQAKALMDSIKGPIEEPYRPTVKQTLANFKRETGFDPAKVDSKLASFDAALDKPLPAATIKAPKPPKPLSPINQAINDSMAKGMTGNVHAKDIQHTFARMANVPIEDLLRVLPEVSKANPGLASEIARIAANYPTVTPKGLSAVILPHIEEALVKNGRRGELQAASELANQTATARKAAETVRNATKKAKGTKAAEAPPADSAPPSGASQSNGGGSNYSVGSRTDFERARTENIDKANKLKDDMYGDIRLSEDLMNSGEVDGFMETLRDLKFSDEANAYLEKHLNGMKDVASAKELSIIERYGREVVAIKKHASQAALDEAMAPRPRGRPRK